MRYLKYLCTLIPLVVYVCIYIVFIHWIGEKTTLYEYKSYIFKGGSTITAALMAAIGVILTIENNQNLKNKELLNDLDQKSEWRKELMNIAAKPVIQLEDVYRILASLRFLPKSEDEIEGKCIKIKKSKQKEFDIISNYIYKKLNIILNDILHALNIKKIQSQKFLNIPLSIKDSEEIRLYTKFLLKHHWEYNKGKKDKKKFKKKELDEFNKVINEIERLNKKTSINNDYYETKDIYIGDLEKKSNDCKEIKNSSQKSKFINFSNYYLRITICLTFLSFVLLFIWSLRQMKGEHDLGLEKLLNHKVFLKLSIFSTLITFFFGSVLPAFYGLWTNPNDSKNKYAPKIEYEMNHRSNVQDTLIFTTFFLFFSLLITFIITFINTNFSLKLGVIIIIIIFIFLIIYPFIFFKRKKN